METARVLLLGGGGVGKTLFVRRHLAMPPHTDAAAICHLYSSPGLDVCECSSDRDLQVWAWLCVHRLPLHHALIFVQRDPIFDATDEAYWRSVARTLAPGAPVMVVETKTNRHKPDRHGVVNLLDDDAGAALARRVRALRPRGDACPAPDLGLTPADLADRQRFVHAIGLACVEQLKFTDDYRSRLGHDAEWGLRVLRTLFGRQRPACLVDFYPATPRVSTAITFANANVSAQGMTCTWVVQGCILHRVHRHMGDAKRVASWLSGVVHELDGILYSVEFADSRDAAQPRQLYVLAKSPRGLADKDVMDAQVCALLAAVAPCPQ